MLIEFILEGKMDKMKKAALKNAALIAAVAAVVFEGLTILVQIIDPQGGLLHVNYRNPVQHIIIVVAALGFGVAAYLRHVRRTKQ